MAPPPIEEWPDAPLTEREARDLLGGDAVAVWVMDHDEATRAAVAPDDGRADGVIDVVLETDDAYRPYGYTRYGCTRHGDGTGWVACGAERKGTDGAERVREALEDYRLLVDDRDR
ncbi:hypothetical protein ACFQPA_06720 [Halomarina halobia]|uniref:Uncharacterized protein n=1 Tax=Halomarina halobia TaxID=3033386 RepID=A0ABD6A6D5_9EURY|nr:hypothetical protein [Halomarina sp. PSR21]